jgi:hypothetical protein
MRGYFLYLFSLLIQFVPETRGFLDKLGMTGGMSK